MTKQELSRLIQALAAYVFRWNLAQENAQELVTELQKLAHYLEEHGAKQTLVELESRSKAISLEVKEKLSAGVSEKWAKALLFLVEADLSSIHLTSEILSSSTSHRSLPTMVGERH